MSFKWQSLHFQLKLVQLYSQSCELLYVLLDSFVHAVIPIKSIFSNFKRNKTSSLYVFIPITIYNDIHYKHEIIFTYCQLDVLTWYASHVYSLNKNLGVNFRKEWNQSEFGVLLCYSLILEWPQGSLGIPEWSLWSLQNEWITQIFTPNSLQIHSNFTLF